MTGTADASGVTGAAIDAILPQTQCRKCGYTGCRPYADAIAHAAAPINRCPPGGAAGIATLAALTGRPALPLDPACGIAAPRRVAVIDEAHCIGCTLCIQACPVDAIVGAPKQMHGVIASLCTGCDLCVPPCPVDCIDMRPAADADAPWDSARREAARERYRRREARLAASRAKLAARREAVFTAPRSADRLDVIRNAVARARAKRAAIASPRPGPEGER